MKPSVESLVAESLDTPGISVETARRLAAAPLEELPGLLAAADEVRRAHFGKRVAFCSIANARSNLCGEDCGFCAQSRRARSGVPTYPLLEEGEVLARAERARAMGAGEFSIVTSGKKPSRRELERIARMLERERALGIERCVSVGTLDREELLRLKEAGLQVFHHNLEAAPEFYRKIVTSRAFEENLAAVRAAKEVGLEVCCGGIFGMGESWEDRVELFRLLREVPVDRVPINFLHPIAGTPLGGRELLGAREALKIIAIGRLMLPRQPLNVAGGREVVLKQLQPLVFMAGATTVLIGDYLTTKGRAPEEDREMVELLGLELAPHHVPTAVAAEGGAAGARNGAGGGSAECG